MQAGWIHLEAGIGAPRGSVVVCIRLRGPRELFADCLRSVLAHTASDIPIVVCDDDSRDPRELMGGLESESTRDVFYLPQEGELGSSADISSALAFAAPADVVLLSSDCVVAKGWLEGMRRAAYVDSTVATSTPLTSDGKRIWPLGTGDPGGLADWRFDDAAAAIRSRSLRLRPRLPTAVGHCVYVRRTALDLVGDFDPGCGSGKGEEVCFSQQCIRAGLSHVLADDVLVLHKGPAGFAGSEQPDVVDEERERMLAARYPYYRAWIRSLQDDVGPLTRSLSCARRALTGLSVVIDARILSRPTTGTEVQVLEVIAALARTEKAQLTVVLPDNVADYGARILESLPGVALVHHSEALARTRGSADVVHRPYQINNPGDLTFLASLGERLIVTNQDLISYHNPSYFKDAGSWDGYRRLTRLALAFADHVVFVSAHARDDALGEDLVEPNRATVVRNGVDHPLADAHESAVPPPGAVELPEGAEAILCIGTDFRHKNRVFALRMLEQLQRRHDWAGYLLFAGPTVPLGSSGSEEAELLARHPRLGESLIDFGAVSEGEKTWLLGRVGLVVYPTIHEGFGLVPFEAAHHRVPCIWAAGTSLREVLPDGVGEIVAWDPMRSADRALKLLRDERARQHQIQAVRRAGSELTWDATAARLLELYDSVCDAAASPVSALGRLESMVHGALSDDAMQLVGPGGALPADVDRPLLALAMHPQLGPTVFGALKLGYRAAYKLRRWGSRGAAGRRS